VAFDPEHRLVLGVVVGKRSGTHVLELLKGVAVQLDGRTPRLTTTDEFGPYRTVISLIWLQPPRPPGGGQERKPPKKRRRQKTLNYATVDKRRKNGRVVEVKGKVIFGTAQSAARALEQSSCSSAINTSFVERHNATDRHRNARKARRTYRFSKDWEIHRAVGYFSYYNYNFCWCVRTLSENVEGRRQKRTPAMAAGFTDHVWSMQEWLSYPAGRHAT
jgi:hypothetical protein